MILVQYWYGVGMFFFKILEWLGVCSGMVLVQCWYSVGMELVWF